MRSAVAAATVLSCGQAFAQEDASTPVIHGFVSQGGFVSTSNDYIGDSSRGSLAFFETGLNVSAEPADRLRAGVQVFARKVGDYEVEPRIDWAFADYAWRPWLGVRAGRIKLPIGLYNEIADVDAARLPVLLPSGLYPVRNRDALIAHTGVGAYGTQPLACGRAGELEYQAWLGTLSVPRSALELNGAELERTDSRYVTGAQVFWRPPHEGVRVGASYTRASIDFDLTLDTALTQALIAAMLVPADFDGSLRIAQRPLQFAIASAEYSGERWTVAAEYGRSWTRQVSSLPAILPEQNRDSEAFYVMGAYRPSEQLEVGAYYSVEHLDVDDRSGRDGVAAMQWAERHHGFQRDLAATLRHDVNEHWLWKLEAHFIDGTAGLMVRNRPGSDRYWGMFLFKTTVTF